MAIIITIIMGRGMGTTTMITSREPTKHILKLSQPAQRQGPGLSLVQYPDPLLRAVCKPVDTFDGALRDLADKMLSLMHHHAGIGLSAPQVGRRERLLVCAVQNEAFTLANIEIHDASQPRDFLEGCLSLPNIHVNVRRPERIRVTGYDVFGQRRSFGAVGLWARVIQHGLDHLNGVLVCDYNHPQVEQCQRCQLEVSASLIEERKQRSRRPL
jgi:peptide deformylase